jgi:hypothetical protein
VIEIPVELRFKGDRTYIHGTDVYASAVDCLQQQWPGIDGRCRFSFHRVTSHPLLALLDTFQNGRPKPDNCVSDMHVTGGRNEASIWFVERKGTITGRYAYDEDAVVKDCIASQRSISRAGPSNYTAIETIVAMTKRLHNVVALPAQGKWLFTRLDLTRLLRAHDADDLSITLASEPKSSLTRSNIAAHGEQLGFIFFSVGRP